MDRVGPALLPFVIRPERFDEIPFLQLGIPSVRMSKLVCQPGEVWVLFCFRDSFRSKVGDGTPLRTDGFPLVLEWRKDVADSPLLADSFHRLADLVRRQLGVRGWGLCPSHARYGDKIAFTDAALFGDAAGGTSPIASAYGAVLAGLSCAVSGKRPTLWPFPSLQWDETRRKPCGVAGLREKLSVAADCGATVVTVAQEQKREARELLERLKGADGSGRYGKLSVHAVRDVADPRTLARCISDDAARRILLFRAALAGVLCVVVALLLAAAYWMDWRREKVLRFADYVERNGVAEGRFPVSDEEMAGRGRTYEFHYRGYDGFCPWSRKRILREMWCVNGKGVMRVDRNDYPEHPAVTGFRYRYDEGGRVSAVERCGASGRVMNVVRYFGERLELADIGGGGNAASGKMRFASSAAGDAVRRIEYVRNDDGYVERMIFRRDSSGVAAADTNGVSQVKFSLLEDGRIESLRYLDWQGKPVADGKGVHIERYAYEGHRLVRIQYFDKDDEPVSRGGREDERVYSYSPQGNLVRVEGRRRGIAIQGLSYERDEVSGDVVRESYSWIEGVAHSKPWSHRVLLMDDGGNVVRETFFDESGEKWRRADNRIATVEREFRPDGKLVQEAFRDEKDRLMYGAEGWAVRRIEHSTIQAGDVVRWCVRRQYLGEDGTPVLVKGLGFAAELKYFDELGRETKWELFGIDNEKVDCTWGWQRAVLEYGRDGNLSATHFYDKDGNEVETGKEK